MNKALEMGKASTIGSFQLFIAKIISTIMLAISTIIIGLFISDVEYGLYYIALIPVTTFILFLDWGVGSALTKYCAQYRAEGKEKNLRKIIVAGLSFVVATGLILTLVLFLMANIIASNVLGEPTSAYLITITSISILFLGIYTTTQSIFVGFERIKLFGVSLISQAAIQLSVSPILVYFGYGAFGVTIGYTLSQLVAGIISLMLLYFFIFKKLDHAKKEEFDIISNFKVLLSYGIPLAISLILIGILPNFFQFVMAFFVDTAIIGHFKVALNFAVLITFFTVPISTLLFPTYSKINPKDEGEVLKSVFSSSVKYTSLFTIPATVALMVLADAIIRTLYADKWVYSPLFLSLYLIQYLFISLGGATKESLLQGLGKTKFLLKMRVLTLCVGIGLALLLIPQFEIVGFILASLFAPMPDLFISLYWIWKRYRISVDFNSSARILLACTSAGLATYIFLNAFSAPSWMMLTAGGGLFLFVYLVSVPLIGAINQDDLNNLRVMFSGLGIVSKLLEILLRLIEVPLKFVAKQSKIRERK